MSNKYSITGCVLAFTGLIISILIIHYWSIYEDSNTWLALVYAKLSSLFFVTEASEPGFTSKGITVTEELAIYITMAIAIILGLVSIIFSFLAIKRQENITYTPIALLLGNAVFILYSIKIALISVVISGLYGIYLQRKTINSLSTR